jgi:hypothetical protein
MVKRFRACAGFVGQKRRKKIPSKLHLLFTRREFIEF